MQKNGVKGRHSAAKRYQDWRMNVLSQSKTVLREIQKALRLVRLIEGKPCGPVGEAGVWASNARAISKLLRNSFKGSHFTFVIVVGGGQVAASERYNEWYNTLLEVLRDFPENFSVEITSESVMGVNPANFYPKDDLAERAQKYHVGDCLIHYDTIDNKGNPGRSFRESQMDSIKDRNGWSSGSDPFIEYKQHNLDSMMAKLREREEANRVTFCQVIDDNFAVCRRFVEKV